MKMEVNDMSFEITKEADKYLNQLNRNSKSGSLDIDWDFYYICALVGMYHRRLNSEIKEDELRELTRSFPQKYHDKKFYIIALLIESEIHRKGVETRSRKELEKFMLKKVEEGETGLSENGEELLNKYAAGGLEIIKEKIGRVEDLHVFFIRLYEEILNVKN